VPEPYAAGCVGREGEAGDEPVDGSGGLAAMRAAVEDHVAVLGDLVAGPGSQPLPFFLRD